MFEPKDLEPELEEIQQRTQEETQNISRFSALYVWSKKTFERESLENDYYETWDKALAEAKELFERLKDDSASDLAKMHLGGLVTAAAVFMRDYSDKMTEEDISWCAELLIPTVIANADTDTRQAITDTTYYDGAASSATILPILLDFASGCDEKFLIKRLIVTALTHANEKVRRGAAEGIREHLWQRDPKFAQTCIIGTIAYARLEKGQPTRKKASIS